MRGAKQAVKVVGASAAAAVLWIQLIAPAAQQLSAEPLATEPPSGLIGVSLGDWPGKPSFFATFKSSGPGNSASSTVSLYFNGDQPVEKDQAPKPQISIVVADGAKINTCDDVNVSIGNNKTFEDLNPQQKHLVIKHIREKSNQEDEDAQPGVLTDLQVSEAASRAQYQILTLEPQPNRYFTEDEQGNRQEVVDAYLDTDCAVSGNVGWVNRSPDARFTTPVVAFGIAARDEEPNTLNSRTNVTAGQDLTLLRSTGVLDPDDSTPEKLSWAASASGWSEVGESKYRVHDGLSAVFRSASLDKKNQDNLFLAGVSLGVVGSLVIAVLSNVFEFAWFVSAMGFKRAGSYISWARSALRSR